MRPISEDGINRIYEYTGNRVLEDCPVECPAQPADVYIPVSKANCEKTPPVVIPHVNVKTLSEARAFPNHYVFVEETQQWVHIDSYGNTATLSNGNLFKNNFEPSKYEAVYKSLVVYDFAKQKGYVFNPAGQYATFGLTVQSGLEG